MGPASVPTLDRIRYELLPFGTAEAEAKAVGRPLTLTVTCSPRHGLEHSLDVGSRLRELGHIVVLHVAARMVRGPQHLDGLLDRMAFAGIADVFLVGGDAVDPEGPYDSAEALLPVLRAHALAPRTIGVAAYPEGHPLIDDATLSRALRAKDGLADYMTTQICFDERLLLDWLERTRDAGVQLPLYAGLPGIVDRRRLLEISVRIGVGASVRLLRKQPGLGRLLGRTRNLTQQLHDAIAPHIGGDLGISGLHLFTFNHLVDTVSLVTCPG